MSMNRRDIFRMIPKGAAAAAVAGAVATEVVNEVAAQPAVEVKPEPPKKKSSPPEKPSLTVNQVVNPKQPEVKTEHKRGPNSALSSSNDYDRGPNGAIYTSTLALGSIDNNSRYVFNGSGASLLDRSSGTQSVELGVNDEGELWLRNTNGEWKKVVTE
jgi:hypothetical protein